MFTHLRMYEKMYSLWPHVFKVSKHHLRDITYYLHVREITYYVHCIACDLTYISNRFPVHHFRIFHHFQFGIWFKCYRELYKKTNKQLLNRNLCLFVDLQHNKQNNSPALFGGVRVAWSLPFCVKFCRSCLFFCPFVFLALCCLSFSYLRLIITPLVSPNLY